MQYVALYCRCAGGSVVLGFHYAHLFCIWGSIVCGMVVECESLLCVGFHCGHLFVVCGGLLGVIFCCL